ncbi:MAG TPA: hypothetical protein VGE47_06430, partial [Burkholderiaceae bacterium]
MLARIASLLVWALLAGSLGFWSLHGFTKPLPTPAQAVPVSSQTPLRSDLARLLGESPKKAAEPEPDTRYELLGVVAPRSQGARDDGEGLALISVDGKPRTLRLGAELPGGMQLVALDARSATLQGEGGAPVSLHLPAHAVNRSVAPTSAMAATAQPAGPPVAAEAAAVTQETPRPARGEAMRPGPNWRLRRG